MTFYVQVYFSNGNHNYFMIDVYGNTMLRLMEAWG